MLPLINVRNLPAARKTSVKPHLANRAGPEHANSSRNSIVKHCVPNRWVSLELGSASRKMLRRLTRVSELKNMDELSLVHVERDQELVFAHSAKGDPGSVYCCPVHLCDADKECQVRFAAANSW